MDIAMWMPFIFLLTAVLIALVESRLIKKNVPLNVTYHSVKFWILVKVTLMIYFFTDLFHHWSNVLFCATVYWFSFDLALNLWRGLPWDYFPKAPDSRIERTLKGIDSELYVIIKAALVVISFILVIWLTL